MADQNNAEEHDMMTSGMLQRATTPELIALRARKEDARFGVYAEWAGILLIAGVLSPMLSRSGLSLAIGAALFGLGSWAMWKWERVSQRAQRDQTAS